ncbi:SCO family protein [Marixanthomonas spongiae]|uniref:SCO family protein n=1 Tax=Marixanthomonas spongiae TaxID=2174845 RepID=A0A2U0I834_9FLAO|nr:SCO family protein [Marixanthomonas spongiae]PVW17258.1 SCO family protein [Marixanthomonas spongiae]
MKKYSYIGITAIILIFGIWAVPKIIDRLSHGEVVKNDRLSTKRPISGTTETAEGSKMVTINKIPEFTFVNQEGDTISNDYYRGKVYVVEFFFSTCPSICPIMNANMVKVEEAFKNEEDFGIASFSIDPEHDTPKVLKEYAEKYGVDHPHWNFLTGDKKDILKLSNEGFKLYAAENPEAEGGFEHSGMFALVDKNGNVRSRIDENGNPLIYYDGLDEKNIHMLIEDIKKLL